MRQTLVVVQVAVSLLLTFGALLFVGTLRNLLAVESGFRSEDVAAARVHLSLPDMPLADRVAVRRALLERIRSAPGVAAAAEVRHVPLSGTGSSIDVWPDAADPAAKSTVRLNAISDGYLEAMGIELLAGRDFTAYDTATSPAVALVNSLSTVAEVTGTLASAARSAACASLRSASARARVAS